MVTRRALRLAGATLAWLGLLAGPAAADPPDPGDVRSEVTAIEPATPAITAEVVGGDSFLRLHVEDGTEVVVTGYEDEPYLRIRADGTVEVNERSPARWLNDDRSGAVDIPDTADPTAAPDWRRTGTGGEASWHDHRIHWMASSRPDPPVRDWVVPIAVDGRAVEIRGTYRFVPPPPVWPWWAGAVGLAVVVVVIGWTRRIVVAAAVAAAGTLAALVGVALWRLPGGGARGGTAVLLGALAVVAAAVAWRGRPPTFSGAFLAGGGVALAVYGLRRADVLSHAVLVTELPPWFDRASVATALGAGAAAVVLGVRAVLVPPWGADRADRADRSGQSGGYQPSGTSASASGGPHEPRS